MRETPIKIVKYGKPIIMHNNAYMVVGKEDAVCFYVDVNQRNYEVTASSFTEKGTPELYISDMKEESEDTVITFPEFVGFKVHCATINKRTIAIALTKEI